MDSCGGLTAYSNFLEQPDMEGLLAALQLPARIARISFREIRNHFFRDSNRVSEYTAANHVVACLSGAVGMLHRSFWMDIILCLTDRYASYLSHLVGSISTPFP